MKKSNIIIALSAALLLAGCGEQNQGGGEPLSASDFAKKFNAHVNLTYKEGTYEEQRPLDVDFGEDHISFLGGSYGSVFYEKTSNGGVNFVSLDVHNVKQSKTVLGETYAESFPNVFTTIASGHKDEKEVALAENNQLNDVGETFLKTFSKIAPITNIKEATGSIAFNENVTLNLTLKNESDATFIFAATFGKPSEYEETKLSVLPETEASKALKAKLDTIKEGNYTVKVKEGETEKATLYVNSDRLLMDKEGTQKGFLKTDTGYKVLAVSGTTVSEEGSSTDLFSSLLPDYDFAPEVIVNDVVSPLVEDGDPIEHLNFPVYPVTSFDSESVKTTDSGLVLTLTDNNVTTTFEWSNIGTTTLPVDISNISVKKTWASEGYADIDAGLKAILGSDIDLPFWDLGDLEWTIDDSGTTPGSSLLLAAYFDDDTEVTDAVAAYASEMEEAGYIELTETEREDLADAGFYLYCDDTSDFENYHVYPVKSSIIEIYKEEDPWFGSSFLLSVTPSKGWTRS